jgi:hypothetical protein
MENVDLSTKVLNGFLTLMVGVLMCIIGAIAVCLILNVIGIF